MKKVTKSIIFFVLFMSSAFAQLNVLLVDDDNFTSPDRLPAVSAAITTAGHNVTVFDAAGTLTIPTANYMKTFNIVVWYASIDGVGLMFWNGTDAVNTEITSYLNGGGKMWVIGTDLLYDFFGGAPVTFSAGNFAYDYLGISSYDVQSFVSDGGAGCPMIIKSPTQTTITPDSLTFIFPTTWYIDGVTPVAASTEAIYLMGPSSYSLFNKPTGVYYDGGTFQVLSFFFDVYEVASQTKLERIFKDALNAFQSAVPVELTSFSASAKNSNVILSWQTATELNNSGFEIEKSINRNDFYKIGFVSGAGTTSETNNYSFADNNTEKQKMYYRLKQIDFDGTFSYSGVVEVGSLSPDKFSLEQNYPNPFNPETKINFSLAEPSFVKLVVYNLLGEVVSVILNENLDAGNYDAAFNAENLPSGLYIYKLESAQFSNVKKMMLMK